MGSPVRRALGPRRWETLARGRATPRASAVQPASDGRESLNSPPNGPVYVMAISGGEQNAVYSSYSPRIDRVRGALHPRGARNRSIRRRAALTKARFSTRPVKTIRPSGRPRGSSGRGVLGPVTLHVLRTGRAQPMGQTSRFRDEFIERAPGSVDVVNTATPRAKPDEPLE